MLELGLLFLVFRLLIKLGRNTFDQVGLAWDHLVGFIKTLFMVAVSVLIMALIHC